jgi:DNA-binding transcriptional LysR family regulator
LVEQLCAFEHLIVDPVGGDPSGPVDSALAKLGHRRRIAIAVPTFDRLLELLKVDDFVAFVPERLLRRWKADLKVFETNLAVPPIDVVVTWHPRLTGDAQHKWLRNVLIRAVSLQ